MKRQTSSVSSSSRRENAPEKVHSKTFGCMSGIIYLVCKSHSPRRLLTFGKKQIMNESSFAEKRSNTSSKHEGEKENLEEVKTSAQNISRLSSEIPRSPTLPAKIRRSNPVKEPENFRTPSALVARLMGFDVRPALAAAPESVAVKRQELLGALQKCDEDLKTLKKIIEAVRSAEQLRTPRQVISRSFGDNIRMTPEMTCSEFKGEQQPSPVSVLDEFTRSPLSPSSYSGRHSNVNLRTGRQKQQLQKRPGEEEMSNPYFYDRMTSEAKDKEEESAMWSSKTMIESVEEVCRDIAWGEKRETGRIGLALQEYICRDMIEEIVREFGCRYLYTLPFEACKRRLCF